VDRGWRVGEAGVPRSNVSGPDGCLTFDFQREQRVEHQVSVLRQPGDPLSDPATFEFAASLLDVFLRHRVGRAVTSEIARLHQQVE